MWSMVAAAKGLWQGNSLWRYSVMVAGASTALAVVFPPVTPVPQPPPSPGVFQADYVPLVQPNVTPSAPARPGVPAPLGGPMAGSVMPAAPVGPIKIAKPSVKAGEAAVVGGKAEDAPIYRPPPPGAVTIMPRRPSG